MIRKLLINWLGGEPKTVPQQISHAMALPAKRPVAPTTPIYPPVDSGIIYCSSSDVIATQTDLIRRIKLLAATTEDEFKRRYLSVIERLAANILLIPASETETHNGPGGLFRLCLELAFYCAQAAEGIVFAGRATAEDRRREEPRWRYAAFIAGLCCQLHRCIVSMTVVDEHGEVWPAVQEPLEGWLASRHGIDRYFVRWKKQNQNHQGGASAGLMVTRIVPADCLQYIQDGSQRIIPIMMDVIAGIETRERQPLFELVDGMVNRVVHRDKSVQPANYGKLTVGTHLEPHLLDAMRQLIRQGVWKINEPKSRIWYSKEGLYLVWRMAAKEMLSILDKNDSAKGVPKDAQTLLEILLAAKVLVLDTDQSPYFSILPPGASTEITVIKFANPMTLLAGIDQEVEPLESFAKPEAKTTQVQEREDDESAKIPPRAEPNLVEAKTNLQPAEEPLSKEISTKPLQSDLPVGETRQSPAPAVTANSQDAKKAGGAIPEVKERHANKVLPEKMAGLLSRSAASVINRVFSEHFAGSAKDYARLVDVGFAIEMEHLSGYGMAIDALLMELAKLGWLYSPPEKPNKKVHQITFNNRPLTCLVIRKEIAAEIGVDAP